MAIQYLFPIPDPVVLAKMSPEELAALPPEIREKLETKSLESLITDLGNHQIFTRPKGLEVWDQVELALEERAKRREMDPTGPDYIAIPSQVLAMLRTCLDEPNFFQATDQGNQWVRGLPYQSPIAVRLMRPLFECIKNPKQVKPVKMVSVPAEEATS